jgi:hypothetical protein
MICIILDLFIQLKGYKSSLKVKNLAHTRVTSVIIWYIWEISAIFLYLAESILISDSIRKDIIEVTYLNQI